MSPETVRRFAPLLVAVVVLAVIGAVWSVLRVTDPAGEGPGGVGSGGEPVPLRLASWLPSGDTPDPRYRLATDLDDEEPDDTAVHRVLPEPERADGLRAALGAQLGREAGELVLEDDGRWFLPGVACAEPVPTTTGAETAVSDCVVDRADPGPSRRQLEVAEPVLRAALGEVPDVEVTDEAGNTTSVTVDPVVAGLPTTGFGTRLVVLGVAVVTGDGWLATTERGPAYPLVSARDAWDALVRSPLPMPLIACPEPLPPGMDPVTCGGPVTVTGARLGLSLQPTDEGPLLVPSWLFAVDSSPQPLVQVAVEPRLLESGPATGGGVPGSPGSATAAPPSQPSPPEPSPESRFTDVSRSADDMGIDVTFWGGVPECYDYRVQADEGPHVVRISVVQKSVIGDKPCIDLAVEVERTVHLREPLGLRRVVDAETGATLLGPVR